MALDSIRNVVLYDNNDQGQVENHSSVSFSQDQLCCQGSFAVLQYLFSFAVAFPALTSLQTKKGIIGVLK